MSPNPKVGLFKVCFTLFGQQWKNYIWTHSSLIWTVAGFGPLIGFVNNNKRIYKHQPYSNLGFGNWNLRPLHVGDMTLVRRGWLCMVALHNANKRPPNSLQGSYANVCILLSVVITEEQHERVLKVKVWIRGRSHVGLDVTLTAGLHLAERTDTSL